MFRGRGCPCLMIFMRVCEDNECNRKGLFQAVSTRLRTILLFQKLIILLLFSHIINFNPEDSDWWKLSLVAKYKVILFWVYFLKVHCIQLLAFHPQMISTIFLEIVNAMHYVLIQDTVAFMIIVWKTQAQEKPQIIIILKFKFISHS